MTIIGIRNSIIYHMTTVDLTSIMVIKQITYGD